MARSSKPRKQYRPKPCGRPVLRDMHRELILPAYLSIEALRAALAVCDEELPYLRTDELTHALLVVDAAVARMVA